MVGMYMTLPDIDALLFLAKRRRRARSVMDYSFCTDNALTCDPAVGEPMTHLWEKNTAFLEGNVKHNVML